MEPPDIQFVGPPCGHHGSYTFYRAFKLTNGNKTKVLSLGQFFFAKITPDSPVCIGDLQLVWHHKNHDGQPLCSVRLYFLPEDTPDGRLACHGEDEIVSESEKVVLKIEDLVTWMCDVRWTKGMQAICKKDVKGPSQDRAELAKMFATNNCGLCESVKAVGCEASPLDDASKQQFEVVILSFPQYCRYRAVRKRLEACADAWMRNAVISAIGGFTVSNPGTRILFCRDTIEHPGLSDHASRQNHLAPNLKGRPRKRKLNFKKVGSFDSDTNDSDEGYDPEMSEEEGERKVGKTSNSSSADHQTKNSPHVGKLYDVFCCQKRKCKFALRPSHKEHLEPEEDAFLKSLYQFMQARNTPISRLPTLGFKELDLFFFYNYTHKLGGYEAITQKRMWKHIYDTLGGHPSNTSAATCTRRHYERLLLPFERRVRGEEGKPLPVPYVKPRRAAQAGTTEISVKTEACSEEPESTAKTKPDKMKPTVACHLKLTEKEKQWEAVRRKSHLNRDKVLSVRKTVKRELQLREQAAVKPHDISDDARTSDRVPVSTASDSLDSEPSSCDLPVSLSHVSVVTLASTVVTQKEVIQGADSTLTQKEVIQGADIEPVSKGNAVQKSENCEAGISEVFSVPSVINLVEQPPVVCVRTTQGDVVNVTSSRDGVVTMSSDGCGRPTTSPSNSSASSSRPSVIHRTESPPSLPIDASRHKSVMNAAPVAVYGPPSHIVPNSTFANGTHATKMQSNSDDRKRTLSELMQISRDMLAHYTPGGSWPQTKFAPTQVPGSSLRTVAAECDDQPKDLSMKTLRNQTLARSLDCATEDGPINLVVARPNVHSPSIQPSCHWDGISSGGMVWNATTRSNQDVGRVMQTQSSQQATPVPAPYVHPAFPLPPGTALSTTPLFYKGPPHQPLPSGAYGRTPGLLTAGPYGRAVIPDLAMFGRPRGPYMVPVGITLVNQTAAHTAAHSKRKSKH